MISAATLVISLLLLWYVGLKGPLIVVGVIVLVSFVLTAKYVPADVRLSGAAKLKLWFGEWAASALNIMILMPFEPLLMPRKKSGLGPPVLLVHGYVNNAGALYFLWRALRRNGFHVMTINLEPVYGGIDEYAARIDAQFEALLTASGMNAASVVCHSMGGLAARAWLRANPHRAAQVTRIITLGTPHQGTALAPLGLGKNCRQMRVGSDWLRELEADEQSEAPAFALVRAVPVIAIGSAHDNVVAPQSSAFLARATPLKFEGVGHVSLPFNSRVIDAVRAQLAQPLPLPAPTAASPTAQ